jgi:fructokinase
MTIKSPIHGKKLLVFGELLWDLLPDGAKPGGAPANVAVNAALAGADCALVSAVGDDERGREMLSILRARNFPTACVQTIAGAGTGAVDVTLSGAGIPSYHIRENVAWDFIENTAAAREAAAGAGAFYFGTLALRSPRSRETLLALLDLAPRGCLRFFDVNLRDPLPAPAVVRESLGRADVLKLNHEELPVVAAMLGLPAGADEFVKALAAEFPVGVVLLTHGAKGAMVYENKVGQASRLPRQTGGALCAPSGKRDACPTFIPASPAEKIVDTVGAGDAFSAGFLCGCLRGLSSAEAAKPGSDLAARVCGNAGAWLPVE